ncbi:hypothetical protein CDAR_377111 [Caerostris darwini]|uniref:Uncharacterized protein n=1 Tax=Caerostris darwini TaxID=1538125 RepID=A0AAV4UQX5_9ARAC|nr:hypothetical protein CDAR_377111 [Caerostris darwini]
MNMLPICSLFIYRSNGLVSELNSASTSLPKAVLTKSRSRKLLKSRSFLFSAPSLPHSSIPPSIFCLFRLPPTHPPNRTNTMLIESALSSRHSPDASPETKEVATGDRISGEAGFVFAKVLDSMAQSPVKSLGLPGEGVWKRLLVY